MPITIHVNLDRSGPRAGTLFEYPDGSGASRHHIVDEVTNAGLLKVNESHIGFAAPLATHGGTGRTGGPHGEMHYPILRTSHMQGAAIVPSGTYTPERLAAEVGLPEHAAV